MGTGFLLLKVLWPPTSLHGYPIFGASRLSGALPLYHAFCKQKWFLYIIWGHAGKTTSQSCCRSK